MLQASQRHVTPNRRRRAGLPRAGAIVALLLALLLAGCADDEGNRQFANDPRTPRPTATMSAGPTMPAEAPPPVHSHASPEALVDRRGAPDAAWWLVDGAVWVIGDGQPRVVVRGGAIASAPAPSGRSAAVVTESDGSYRIDIYDVDGRRTKTFDDVLAVPGPGASPVAAAAQPAPAVTLDWSPQGNRLLFGHESGVLIDIPLDGKPSAIETRVPLTRIAQAAWSPRGDVIAVVVRAEDGAGSLAIVDPAQSPASVSVIAPVGRRGERAASVETFDWKPRGDGIVFIEAQRDDGPPSDGMVVAWDRETNSTQILATGAQGGPTGSVAWLSVAPDGKAVAYIVTTGGDEGSSFIGLFVRSMIDGQLYRVPVAADAAVVRAWWLGDGLAWASLVGDPATPLETRFLFIDGLGERSTLGTFTPQTRATPIASPAASPADLAASPVASPVVATPVASPVASPMAFPAASPGA